jgi:hypothetical protein
MDLRPATVEYLIQLVAWSGGRQQFCAKTGVHVQNLSAYLNGTKRIAWKRLQAATRSVFGEPPAFVPVLELHDLRVDGIPALNKIGRESGVYALFDSAMRVLYFGKATDLYAEVRQTLKRSVDHVRTLDSRKTMKFGDVAAYLSAYYIPRSDATFRHDLEALGLRIMRNTTFNKNFGRFARKG